MQSSTALYEEKRANRWIKTDRVGNVTLFVTKRSPFWWMYWREVDAAKASTSGCRQRFRAYNMSTHETDLSLARVIAAKKNEELFKRSQYPELSQAKKKPHRLRPVIDEFVAYVVDLGRSQEHIKNLRGRMLLLADWMAERQMARLDHVTPALLRRFTEHLKANRCLKPSTINHYLDAVHNFFGYAIYKRRLITGPNPAATGRQAELDRLPARTLPPPTIYPDQVNAVIEVANAHHDGQIVHLVVFVCEGGFRFQELQFLQVGDVDLDGREIVLDIKRPDPDRVRPELRRRCMTPDGFWMPKSRAGRRVVHVTDRLVKLIARMGKGDPSDWVFLNQAGNQIAQNKTLLRLKKYALEAGVLVAQHPGTGEPWSLMRWHWLRHYHRTRAHVSKIRREVSKLAMGHAADAIHDHYRGVDVFAFHEEYAKFDSGLDDDLIGTS